jgi:hypothetical protein
MQIDAIIFSGLWKYLVRPHGVTAQLKPVSLQNNINDSRKFVDEVAAIASDTEAVRCSF